MLHLLLGFVKFIILEEWCQCDAVQMCKRNWRSRMTRFCQLVKPQQKVWKCDLTVAWGLVLAFVSDRIGGCPTMSCACRKVLTGTTRRT